MEIWNAREAHTRPIQRMSDLFVWVEGVIKQMQHLQLPSVAWLQHCPDSAIPGDVWWDDSSLVVSPRDQSYWILTCLVAILLAFFRECRWCFQHILGMIFHPQDLGKYPTEAITWRLSARIVVFIKWVGWFNDSNGLGGSTIQSPSIAMMNQWTVIKGRVIEKNKSYYPRSMIFCW